MPMEFELKCTFVGFNNINGNGFFTQGNTCAELHFDNDLKKLLKEKQFQEINVLCCIYSNKEICVKEIT
nr:MAG TPA: hypothetical protein [Caudoviricetes sp.]